jgi:1-deoxyxylulose-5-phosphate synthase
MIWHRNWEHETMKRKQIGRSGLCVSELCVGCMSFGDPTRGGHPWTLPEEQSRRLIRQAYEAGLNFFDTANIYSDGLDSVLA